MSDMTTAMNNTLAEIGLPEYSNTDLITATEDIPQVRMLAQLVWDFASKRVSASQYADKMARDLARQAESTGMPRSILADSTLRQYEDAISAMEALRGPMNAAAAPLRTSN